MFANPEHPQRKAIEITPAGHVLVIDCRGDTRAACAGQILVTRLMKRGVAGLVGDGGIRDAGPIGEMTHFPVFCAGPSAPLNLARHHAVESNVPIGCGGVAVYPGDIIVGDRDGVAVIPPAMADEVARDAAEQEELEEFLLQRVADGAALPGTYPPNEATRPRSRQWRAARQRAEAATLSGGNDKKAGSVRIVRAAAQCFGVNPSRSCIEWITYRRWHAGCPHAV